MGHVARAENERKGTDRSRARDEGVVWKGVPKLTACCARARPRYGILRDSVGFHSTRAILGVFENVQEPKPLPCEVQT